MGSIRKQEANRRNAQKSTGPRTPAGRARASSNALKHGLATAERLPALGSTADEVAQDLLDEFGTGQQIAPELIRIVEAEVDLLRARYIRTVLAQRLHAVIKDETSKDNAMALLDQLSRVDRYERRALSRRKFAVRNLTQALSASSLSSPDNDSGPLAGTSSSSGLARA